MSRASMFVIDKDQVVHQRFCAMGQSYTPQTVTWDEEGRPVIVETKTVEQMLENLARGDSQNQYGNTKGGTSMLTGCPECIMGDT